MVKMSQYWDWKIVNQLKKWGFTKAQIKKITTINKKDIDRYYVKRGK
jgi:hypothetical protein